MELDRDAARELEESLTLALIRLSADNAPEALRRNGWRPCRSGYGANMLRSLERRGLLRYLLDSNTLELSPDGIAVGDRELERLANALGMLPEPEADGGDPAATAPLFPIDEDDDRLLRVRIELDLGDYPACWREVDIPAHATFLDLHLVIQRVFCWNDEHAFSFEAACDVGTVFLEEASFGDREVEQGLFDDEVALLSARHTETEPDRHAILEARTVPIGALLTEASPVTYRYDLANSWTHTISLVDVSGGAAVSPMPYLTFGAGDAPPEGTEGADGYHRFRAIMSGPRNAERADAYRWARAEGYRIFELSSKRRELADHFADDRRRWAERLAG